MLDRVIAEKIKEAMKSKDDITKNTLRLLKGEIERCVGETSDEAKFAIARKIIKNNQTTIDQAIENYGGENSFSDDLKTRISTLRKENDVLRGILPKSMDENELKAFIDSKGINVKSFSNQGQAIGAINKEVKKDKVVVDMDIIRGFVDKMFK